MGKEGGRLTGTWSKPIKFTQPNGKPGFNGMTTSMVDGLCDVEINYSQRMKTSSRTAHLKPGQLAMIPTQKQSCKVQMRDLVELARCPAFGVRRFDLPVGVHDYLHS